MGEKLDKFIKVSGVVLCGSKSANGRIYTEDCLRRAAGLYVGKPIYVDHSLSKKLVAKVGIVERAWFKSGKVYGDVLLSPVHPATKIIVWAAKECPEWCGFSHDAVVDIDETKQPNVVRNIKEIISVDIVADAATTKHLFESVSFSHFSSRGTLMLESLKDIVARLEKGELDEDTARSELGMLLKGPAKDAIDELFDEEEEEVEGATGEEEEYGGEKKVEEEDGEEVAAKKVAESRKRRCGEDIGWRVWEFCAKRNIALTPKQMSVLKRVTNVKDAEMLCEAFAEQPAFRKIVESRNGRPQKSPAEQAAEDMEAIIADIRKRKNLNLN